MPASKGRAGVAPSRCCYICGGAAYTSGPTGHIVCYQCAGNWPFAAAESLPNEDLHDPHADTEPEPEAASAPEGVPDALVPWLRTVVSYARRQ